MYKTFGRFKDSRKLSEEHFSAHPGAELFTFVCIKPEEEKCKAANVNNHKNIKQKNLLRNEKTHTKHTKNNYKVNKNV